MESVLPFPFKGESKRSGEGAIGMGVGRKHYTALIFLRSSAFIGGQSLFLGLRMLIMFVTRRNDDSDGFGVSLTPACER